MYVINPLKQRADQPTRTIDATDRAIVRVLERSPDASNRFIAAEVGVQEATVARRIRDLVSHDFIRVTVQTNARAFGFEAFGFVDLDVAPGETETVVERLATFEEVFSVHLLVGNPQIIAIVMASSSDRLFEFARKTLANIPGVRNVNAAQSLRMVKYKTKVSSLRLRT